MIKNGIFLAFAAWLFLAACQPKSEPATQGVTMASDGKLPADFEAFYQKFLTDSTYQMAHITWPLEGVKTIQIDSVTPKATGTKWTLEEWQMHRLDAINEREVIRKFQNIGDILIIEQIRARSVNFGIERRYAKQANNEWELIYYAAAHEMQ